MRTVVIDPITRLEGHGKISIFLDDGGDVERAIFQVPELRGFEAFAVGRPVEDMPQITSRICGVCPTAHHLAGAKAVDMVYGVRPTEAARLIRELLNCLFFAEDHALHFFVLAGPDFILGPGAPAAERNILGAVEKLGRETGKRVIEMRKRLRDVMILLAGKAAHPVAALPGGVAKGVSEEDRKVIAALGKDAVEFALFALELFEEGVLGNDEYREMISSDTYTHETNYMGMVDPGRKVSFYDGDIRVVGPAGNEILSFGPERYMDHIAEHVEDWTYMKFPYLRALGWQGFTDGPASGVYRVAPLARLNVADGMSTPLAQGEYEKLYATFGGKPVHRTLANHWARLVEMLSACERIREIADEPELTSKDIRNMDLRMTGEGVGAVEAPRGTLFHHYKTDDRGIVVSCNLVVATVNNAAALSMSVERAAKDLIKGGRVSDELLNKVEMAFRAYDPCLSCATHAMPGKMPLEVKIFDSRRELVEVIAR